MKKIRLPMTTTVSITWKREDMMKALNSGEMFPIGTMSGDEANKTLEEVRVNVGIVIYSTTSIEQRLEQFIAEYLFGIMVGPNPSRQFFNDEIVRSSSFTYSFKKELARKIAEAEGFVVGKDKEALSSSLKKIMDYRNTFAHGSYRYEQGVGVYVSYYQSARKSELLNDDYWTKLEAEFSTCNQLIDVLTKKLSEKSIERFKASHPRIDKPQAEGEGPQPPPA